MRGRVRVRVRVKKGWVRVRVSLPREEKFFAPTKFPLHSIHLMSDYRGEVLCD